MTGIAYTATKTRSGRPGWSVIFSHPCRSDARGKFGLKVRRGLGTSDDTKADRLVNQLNELLADQSWWSLDRRKDAERQFDGIVVKAFFDSMEVGKVQPKERRDEMIPLPTHDDGYARVMLVGTTGAGKTTLLRQLVGSDHNRDRFPSTSTAKTTTADIEIVTGKDRPFKAAITFMSEHEVRCAVEECLEEACASVIRGQDNEGVARALLEHPEQRFRLSYPLGSWQQESPNHEMEDLFDDEESEEDTLPEEEVVPALELAKNNKRLREYVDRVRKVASEVHDSIMPSMGEYHRIENATRRQEWIEGFTDELYENQTFSRISLDIMDSVRDRFDLISEGIFEPEEADWPTLWYYENSDRSVFLKQVRWFTGNHHQQFGRLLTPLVDGIRVCGPFQSELNELQDGPRRLVLIDGEGLGHSAREATSVSTKVTERFRDVNMILLVDNAQSPMQAAPLELLRSVGSSGHGHKIGVAFTHFDQVRGDNLRTGTQKVNHVDASIGNALSSIRESLGAPVTEILKMQLDNRKFYLGGLDRSADRIGRRFVGEIRKLLDIMQHSSEPSEPVQAAPNYSVRRLELALRDAADEFKQPWSGRLGLSYHQSIQKEHWGRIKALCRRIANGWENEYSGLRPVADLVRQLQGSISRWLDDPDGWTSEPENEDEKKAAVDNVRQQVFTDIHRLADSRLIGSHPAEWRTAFSGFSGKGSSLGRAKEMSLIYESAAPSIGSVMDSSAQEFLDQVLKIVRDAVVDAGGEVFGIIS